ncbi:MAG: hypothetical protein Q7K21_06195 [Elusimicrobiota bacterium]|nr:hypothetical protein [Elusimicrobiota bacterium]
MKLQKLSKTLGVCLVLIVFLPAVVIRIVSLAAQSTKAIILISAVSTQEIKPVFV